MQPELNRGHNNFENGSPSVDYSFEVPDLNSSPEVNQGSQHENREQRPSSAEMAPPQPVVVAPSVPMPTTAAPVQTAAPEQAASASLDANDDDIIEIEWVKIAKQVINQTQDDPRAREKALSELQKDYLMKRYGKVIGE